MNVIARTRPTTKITDAEMQRRRDALERADAHNRIEGLIPTAASDDVFNAFVRGEIEFEDIGPRIKALHQLRP
jgi:hypothetical protein